MDHNNKIHSGIYDGYGNIIIKGTPIPISDEKQKLLIVCHSDCLKLLKQSLNYNFDFNAFVKQMNRH